MKKNKMWRKLLLDLIMLILFVLLLRKMNFGLAFHEVAGLFILAAFVLHLIWNRQWICNITKQFFGKNMRFRARLSWILNFLLLVCFILIGISGIFISKVLFHFSIAGSWKVIHYFCTALAMILLGIHVGLHAAMIGNAIRKILYLPEKVAKPIFLCLTVAMVCLGAYSIATDSFGRWLSMPFQAQAAMPQGDHPEFSGRGEREKGSGGNEERPNGKHLNGEHFNGERPEGDFAGNHSMQKGQTGGIGVLWNSLKNLSIVYLFAALTALLDKVITRRKVTA